MNSSRVAIVGYALEPYSGESTAFAEEAGYRVVHTARERAGLARERISSVHNATMDLFDGVTISNGILGPAGGGYDRDCTRIQNGGAFAVISACASILSGATDVAVVSSVDSVTTDLLKVSNFSSSVYFEQPLGMNFLTSYALFSSAWMDRRQISEELIAEVAAHSYRAGAENEYAHVREGFSRSDVLTSEMIASPLRAHTVAMRRSYGAAALILASADTARQLAVEPLFVAGFGMSTFADELDDWLEMSAVKKAARAAYAMAGLTDPAAQAAAVEINGPFAPFDLAAWSALELCSAGDEAALLAATTNGGVRINPSGGTLCTNAPNSGGLFRIVQAILSLQGADVHDGRTRAIVHDSDLSLGVAGSSHAVVVLEKGG